MSTVAIDDDDHHHNSSNNLNQNISFTEESCSDSDNKINVNVGRTIVPDNNDDISVVAVRFWWIRHGETIANHDGVVVGQWDSPLSIKGQHQATMLGKHLFFSSRDVDINSNNSDNGTTARNRGDTNGDIDNDEADDGGTNRNRNENNDDDIETKTTTKKKQVEPKTKPSQTGWSRIYCSDLGRTKQTLSAMLNGSTGSTNHFRSSVEEVVEPETNSCSDSTVHNNNDSQGGYLISYDKRLREVAKGVRQEFPKSWTSQQALIERQRLDKPTNILQESRADVWSRVAHFVTSVMIDRCYDNQSSRKTQSIHSNRNKFNASSCRPEMTTNEEHNNKNKNRRNHDVEDVMVICHAGLIRTMLQYMVPAAHPSLSHRDDDHDLHGPPDDTKRLAVPNTSVTVLEVRMNPVFIQTLQQQRRLPRDDPQQLVGQPQPVLLQQQELDDDGNKCYRRMPHCPGHQQEQEQILEPHHEKQHETDQVHDSTPAMSTAVTNLFQNEDSTTRDDLILQLDPVTNYNDLWTTTVIDFMWTGHLNDSEGSTNDE